MPSRRAFWFISLTKLASDPPIPSASTMAASLADLVIRPRIACSILIFRPALRSSFVGGCPAALREIGKYCPSSIRFFCNASNVKYSVIILVREAGYFGSSALARYSTSPLPASIRIDAYFDWADAEPAENAYNASVSATARDGPQTRVRLYDDRCMAEPPCHPQRFNFR